MKKIIIYTSFLIFIPFLVVTIFNNLKVKEISLNYVTNTTIRVKRLEKNTIEVINLEEYIVGVLAGEMPIYFEKEALKAQAVASRSYALKRIEYNKDKEYDVVDSTLNQVYLDLDYLKSRWDNNYVSYINKLRECVNETMDEYLEYDGKVVEAMFFSTSNGYTENVKDVFDLDLPYLKSVESVWDSEVSTAFNYEKTMSLQEFYERLGIKYNDVLDIKILSRSNTNRVLKININNNEISGRDMYNRLGLRSTDFEIKRLGSNVIIKTKGYGHGVGMSQYGAQGMAKEGYNYKEILSHYYVDTNINKII